MATIINADTVAGGVQLSGDSTGVLALQGGGQTGLYINSSGAVGVGSTPDYGAFGYALISNGPSAKPSWIPISGVVTTPTLSGVTSANGNTTITVTITNYNAANAYNVAATGGTFTRSGATISWTLPAVSANTIHYLYVQATNSGNSSTLATHTVNVLTNLVADTSFSVTNFAVNTLNSGWTI